MTLKNIAIIFLFAVVTGCTEKNNSSNHTITIKSSEEGQTMDNKNTKTVDTVHENIFLESLNPKSKRYAIMEDDGRRWKTMEVAVGYI